MTAPGLRVAVVPVVPVVRSPFAETPLGVLIERTGGLEVTLLELPLSTV
jgi:hypothetical protein